MMGMMEPSRAFLPPIGPSLSHLLDPLALLRFGSFSERSQRFGQQAGREVPGGRGDNTKYLDKG